MRTMDQIVERLKSPDTDLFGFEAEVLVPFVTAEAWQSLCPHKRIDEFAAEALTEENVLAQAQEYMEFAWGKIQNHRGLSASRSVTKLCSFLWLLDREDANALLDRIDNREVTYAQYGAPILAAICEIFDWPVPDDDATQRMIQGEPCGRCDCDCSAS